MKDLLKSLLMLVGIWCAVTLLDHFWGDIGVFFGIGAFCVLGFNYEIGRLKERVESLEYELRGRQDRSTF